MLPLFLFLAQATLLSASTPSSQLPPAWSPSASVPFDPNTPALEPDQLPVAVPPVAIPPPRHGKTAPIPAPSPEVRITVVNAMSIPAISLSTNGAALPVAYPYFPQGLWTGHEPLKTSVIHYLARSIDRRIMVDRTLHFQPVSSQILLLTGDLSTSGSPDAPPPLGQAPFSGTKPWPPNLQFHVYPSGGGDKERCRYRIVNGMPSKLLILRSVAEPNKPSRQLALLAPGNSALLIRQPPNIEWEVEIDGQISRLAMEQENAGKNCLIPFFLRDGHPTFIRVFENP